WVSSNPSELLFWVPAHHRMGLVLPNTKLVIGRPQTAFSFEKFVHGSDWAKCYVPSRNAGV
ncbi:hypothetical protein C8F04DRAFT_968506, partial [Mycena alexandri]